MGSNGVACPVLTQQPLGLVLVPLHPPSSTVPVVPTTTKRGAATEATNYFKRVLLLRDMLQ